MTTDYLGSVEMTVSSRSLSLLAYRPCNASRYAPADARCGKDFRLQDIVHPESSGLQSIPHLPRGVYHDSVRTSFFKWEPGGRQDYFAKTELILPLHGVR